LTNNTVSKEITREKRVEMGSPLPSVLLECREPLLALTTRFLGEGGEIAETGRKKT
jgi:hypothetical protein